MRRKHKVDPRKQRELAASWSDIVNRWENTQKFSQQNSATTKIATSTSIDMPRRVDEISKIPSLITTGGDTYVKPVQIYTGTAMIGIATMHKSNSVPVFSKDAAVEISKMRRG